MASGPDPSSDSDPSTGSDAPGIPEAPEGTPRLGGRKDDFDEGAPVGPTPAMDFWQALYSRRSVRKFKPDPVPRELVRQVMHAGSGRPAPATTRCGTSSPSTTRRRTRG